MALGIPGFRQHRGWEVIPDLRMDGALSHKKRTREQFSSKCKVMV